MILYYNHIGYFMQTYIYIYVYMHLRVMPIHFQCLSGMPGLTGFTLALFEGIGGTSTSIP